MMLDRAYSTINRERLSVLVALVVLSLSLLPLIESPATTGLGTSFLGTPLRLEFSATTFISLLAAALTCAGADVLMRSHPRVRSGEVTRTFPTWISPALTVVVAAQLLANITDGRTWVVGLALTGALLWAIVAAEYLTLDPEAPAAGRARLFLNIVAYVLAVLLFGLIWNTRARSLLTAPLTLLAAGSLAFDLLWASGARLSRVAMLAGAIGLVMAQGSWAINYWRTDVFTAAISQLLVFYALVGLVSQYLLDRLTRRVLLEFVVVMAVALVLMLRPH